VGFGGGGWVPTKRRVGCLLHLKDNVSAPLVGIHVLKGYYNV